MRTFLIDTDNNNTAHVDVPADAANIETFTSAKELAKLTAEWPASRLRRSLEQFRWSDAL